MISFIEFFNQKKVVNRDWVKIRRSDYEKYFETSVWLSVPGSSFFFLRKG